MNKNTVQYINQILKSNIYCFPDTIQTQLNSYIDKYMNFKIKIQQ